MSRKDYSVFVSPANEEIARLTAALAERDAMITDVREALAHARHTMWELGFSSDDLQPIRAALARIDALKGGA